MSTSKKNWSLALLLALLLPLVPCGAILRADAAAAQVNINTADTAALDTLPGIGATKAAAIVSYREAHGPFASIEDVQKVSGIGPVTFEKLKTLITVTGYASTGARQETPQPSARATSSQPVQTVVPVTSPKATAHENKHTAAPRETGTTASWGAAVATSPAVDNPPEDLMPAPAPSRAPVSTGGFFSSTWAIGLLAVVALAGGAFMIL